MREIKRWMTTEKIHQNVNSFGLIFVYHKIDDQGFILDVFGRRAFNIDELTKGLNEVKTLHRKPKFIIIQTGNEGKSSFHKSIRGFPKINHSGIDVKIVLEQN